MTQNTAQSHPVEPIDPRSNMDRRRHFRAEIPLKARFLTEPGEEFPCLVSNISAGGALLRAKTPPEAGQKIILYVDDVGRFEGKVVRAGKHTFAVDYRSRRSKSKRTADSLMNAMNSAGRRFDRRAAPRIKSNSDATVVMENGETIVCSIRDISLTGASIEIDPRPPLGTPLQLGRMMAKVVRRHEKGVGVVFTGPAKHMEDVIEQTAAAPAPSDGPALAKSFGRKDNNSA